MVDEEVGLLHEHLGGLPRDVEADEVLHEIWLDDVHNSTAIEGNTMTRAQVVALVDHRKASASLLESLEVEGYAKAADWVYRMADDYRGIPVTVVSEVHKITVELAWRIEPPATRDTPGDWRKGPVRVRAVETSVSAAIPADLAAWSDSTARRNDDIHPVIHAAIHHAWFERIHPFVDGNGRVGRLLLNFMLFQYGYPPAIILAAERRRYLHALGTADAGNANPLAEIIARGVSRTLNRFLIPKLAGEAKLVPLSSLAAQGRYSLVYLRRRARQGKLRAIRDGHLWLSSRAWLAEYLRQRDPRGRKRPRPAHKRPNTRRGKT